MKLFVAYLLLSSGSLAAEGVRSQVSKQHMVDDNHGVDTTDNTNVGSSAQKISLKGSEAVRSAPKPILDLDILTHNKGAPSRGLAKHQCPKGEANPRGEAVVCVNGYVLDGDDDDSNNITCEDACDGKCCVGRVSCRKFTGTVCKDGVSCFGRAACSAASIGLVSQGCIGDYSACFAASIGFVSQGCIGSNSCDTASIGIVSEGCGANDACLCVGTTQGCLSVDIPSSSVIKGCCNTAYECQDIEKDEDLPAECSPSSRSTKSAKKNRH